MKEKRTLKILSNILFALGAAMAALALYLIISTRLSLPPGACPIDNNRPLIFASIGVLLISLVFSFAADRHKKNLGRKADKQDDTEARGGGAD